MNADSSSQFDVLFPQWNQCMGWVLKLLITRCHIAALGSKSQTKSYPSPIGAPASWFDFISSQNLRNRCYFFKVTVCSSERLGDMPGRRKMRDWNYRHHQKCRGGKCRTGNIGTMWHGVENAGLELSAPNCRGGKCRNKQLWKAKTPAGLEVSLVLLTCYSSHKTYI